MVKLFTCSLPTHDPNSRKVVVTGNDRGITTYHEVRVGRMTWISPILGRGETCYDLLMIPGFIFLIPSWI